MSGSGEEAGWAQRRWRRVGAAFGRRMHMLERFPKFFPIKHLCLVIDEFPENEATDISSSKFKWSQFTTIVFLESFFKITIHNRSGPL
jgi:hypothetical protein